MAGGTGALATPSTRPPAGYREVVVGTTRLVARAEHAAELADLVSRGTLHAYAATHAARRALAGRDVSYAIPLPRSGTAVVVRHNRHGGMLARFTGDRFLPPTRAPYELDVALRLAAAGIPTPDLVAFAIYAAGALRRSDTLTREVASAHDLAAVLTQGDDEERASALGATAALVAALSAAGARHHDLNVKNVLLERRDGGLQALVLDVDRVTFERPGEAVLERNLARLLRSARKWRDRYGARVSEAELAELATAARAPRASPDVRPSTRS